jgi:hypothetical protein
MSSDTGAAPAIAEPTAPVSAPEAADPVASMVSGALSNVLSGSAPAPEPAPVTEAPAEVRARRTSTFGQFAVPLVPNPRKNHPLSRCPELSLTPKPPSFPT